jgi:hypothetical protein
MPAILDEAVEPERNRRLPPVQVTAGVSGSGRVGDLVDCLKLDGSESSESVAPLAAVRLLDPGNDRQSSLRPGWIGRCDVEGPFEFLALVEHGADRGAQVGA